MVIFFGSAWLVAAVIIMIIAPYMIKKEPLPIAVADRLNLRDFPINKVMIFPDKKKHAKIMGLLFSRTILLSDALVDTGDMDLIQSAFDHEFTHHCRRHLGQLLIMYISVHLMGLLLALFAWLRAGDITAWIVYGLFCVLSVIARNWRTRLLEIQTYSLSGVH
ncbi:MAG: M48 family metalloprotease [bacterium]